MMSAVEKEAIPGPVSALVPLSKGRGPTLSGGIASSWPLRAAGDEAPRRLRGDGYVPFVVDAKGARQSPQTLKVRPAVFLSLIDRLDHPLIAHHKRPFGGHIYTVQCGAFVVQTRSPEKLSFVDGFEHRMETTSSAERNPTQEHRMSIESARDSRDDGDSGVVRRTEPLMELQTDDGYYVTEWWNTPEDPALSVARMRIEPGVSTQPYQLHGITERYLFLSGNGFIEVDGQVHTVGPGDGMLIKPGAWRSVTNKGLRDLGWLAICRPRFSRLDPNLDKTKYVKKG